MKRIALGTCIGAVIALAATGAAQTPSKVTEIRRVVTKLDASNKAVVMVADRACGSGPS